MYWFIVAAIALVVAIGIGKYFSKDGGFFTNAPVEIVPMVACLYAIVFFILICAIRDSVGFKTFEAKYELQKELYSTVSTADNYIATENIIETNDQLFVFQAGKKQFGNWSMIPERVLDMEPIRIK